MAKKKNLPFIILGVLALLALSIFLAGVYLSNRIENKISQALDGEAVYKEIDVDLWQKKITIQDLRQEEGSRKIFIKRIALEGIGFYDYVFNNEIIIEDLIVEEPEIQLPDRDNKGPSALQQKLEKTILIKNFKVTSGTFNLLGSDSTKNAIFVQFPELSLKDVAIDSSTIRRKIPFNYSSYEFLADSVRLNMNPEHFIAASEVILDTSKAVVNDFRIIPYFTKTEFDRTVGYEKDRISLRVDSIKLMSLDFDFRKDTLHLTSPQMVISHGDLEIYRNRLLPDTIYTKPLYSQVLRNAPVKMDVEEVQIAGTEIVYEEKVAADRPAAKVGFYDINGQIKNLTNMRLDRQDFPTTIIDVDANFLHVAPVKVEWSFDINNPEDRFLISGNFGKVPATALNDYLRPAMNIQAEGALESVSFTFSGDEEVAVGDVRVIYDQFKIQLLEEDGRGIKNFLSSIANLFVDNDGLSEEDVVKDVRIERDPTKSFWNYIWSGVQKGLKESLSQF